MNKIYNKKLKFWKVKCVINTKKKTKIDQVKMRFNAHIEVNIFSIHFRFFLLWKCEL